MDRKIENYVGIVLDDVCDTSINIDPGKPAAEVSQT